ncbi:type II secretion system protein [Duganella sp. Root1480D1]|uniref:type II secretion system protein n=1 Tax=Duganella sp. Root1480D1 TaxID=1736471 RepID=UPI00070B69AB|nr:prepilin-type N-terminal cleavage/methylation domain-containing protein [Duganella sp. Root1480D1]KQZ32562.1 type II secretion system protein G [Duganella sp. Root1480D1]
MRVPRGFTMIELMVALAILAVILTISAPKYFNNLDAAKESTLREDLFVMRDAIDKHFSDHGRYPDSLNELVEKRYLRAVPIDPITQKTSSWVLKPPTDTSLGAVYDVHSGAPNKARDGTAYQDW